jgi:site-specific recombinase XerD
LCITDDVLLRTLCRPEESNLFTLSYRDWLGSSVLSQSADAYVGYLQDQRYCPASVRAYVHSVEHFAHWLTKRRVSLGSINDGLVGHFVTKHLPTCKCPSPCQRNVSAVRPALGHLLHVLRAEGCISEQPVLVPQAIQHELDRFDAHLDAVCGLAQATRTSRRMWVGKFLVDHFGSAPIEIERVQPIDIVEFMVRPTNHYSPGTAGVLGSALRSYLRFRALSCEDRVETLVAAVPTVAQWRLAAVPTHLTSEEIGRFLDAFDRHTSSGQRGYAMARCLSDIGLRASEVAAIQLDDLNWREGTLTIGRGKSRRADVLPLPVAAGKAIVQYLQGARPKSANRALFVRHRAPFNAPISAEFVRGAVRRAFARCGLERYTGTHVLRHSAAMRMRCAGASLKEIADVLRHRSLDTTRIYAKVDLPRLAAVAAPWPGGLS